MNSPLEVATNYVAIGKKKTELSIVKMLIMGILAGAFIAFGAAASSTAAFSAPTAGMVRVMSAIFFPGGLAMVLLAGSELFTGNTLILISVLEKQAKFSAMLKNWLFVYIGNFIGAVLIALLVNASGQLNIGSSELALFTMKVANTKASLSFSNAFFSGILCNMLVCLAVWVSFASKDVVGKVIALYLPIAIFVLAGFEHSVANMYYVPAGIFASMNPAYAQLAAEKAMTFANLNFGAFFMNNLIPVTLGNIVGGALCIGATYWYVFLKKESN